MRTLVRPRSWSRCFGRKSLGRTWVRAK